MKVSKFPTLYICLFFIIGIICNHYFKTSIEISFIIALIIGLVTIFHYQKIKNNYTRRLDTLLLIALFSMALGNLNLSIHSDINYKSHYRNYIKDNRKHQITGYVTERIKSNIYNEKYYFQIERLDNKNVSGKIVMNIAKKNCVKKIIPGDRLLLYSNIESIPKPKNPFQFDYSLYLSENNIWHQCYAHTATIFVLENSHKPIRYLNKLREKIFSLLNKHHFDKNVLNIIKALLIGQRQDIDQNITKNYADAGVIHILAISGLHIGLIYSILLALIKPLNRYRNYKTIQFLFTICILWGFAILSGLSASVVRSVVMFSFMSIGNLMNRKPNIFNTITASILLILFWKPHFLFNIGFQLSYTAVFFIVWLHPLIKKYWYSKNKYINYCIDLITLSVIAQIGVLPISLYYFHQFPILFLPANLVIIPLSSIVLTLSICVILMTVAWTDGAIILGKVLNYLIGLMNQFIEWIVSFDGCILRNIPFSIILTITSYFLIFSLSLLLIQRTQRRITSSLFSLYFLQLVLFMNINAKNNKDEFIIMDQRKKTIIVQQNKGNLKIYSDASNVMDLPVIQNYEKNSFNQNLHQYPLRNIFYCNSKTILLVDSLGIYNTKRKPSILILTHSPKINLERLINSMRPEKIIADGSNYKSDVKKWKETCRKEKIPFHSTSEKGFYKLN